MSNPLHILVVVGSLGRESSTRQVMRLAARRLQDSGCAADVLDLAEEPLPLFDGDTSWTAPGYSGLKSRVERADVFLLGTPDYHGCMSGALKNFLDHFWKEFAGKLFASIVASHEKGLTVTDQIRTVARQCYAWSLPYGVSFADKADVQEGEIVNAEFAARFDMMLRDVRVYGSLLATQRRTDLAGTDPGFLARYRKAQPPKTDRALA
jgi:FMN reductase